MEEFEEVGSMESLQEKTLTTCHEILKKKLDVKEIYLPMKEKNLLTSEDSHVLQPDSAKSTGDKVIYIIDMLPRKGKGWWDKFIASLKESTGGTAHELLASMLCSHLKRRIVDQKSRDWYSRRVRNDSVHVPSGVAMSMHDFISEYSASEYDLLRDQTASPDIVKMRPDLADILLPINTYIVQQKEKLDSVQYCYKVMINQVGLLQAFDVLLENTENFRDALSALLQLYIDKFLCKNFWQLTTVEQDVINIIEDITECTEDIDINKEKEVWTQCVKKIERNRDIVKETLYSQNTTRMASNQATWKLEGIVAKEAKDWITVRKQVVGLGFDSLDKLNKLRILDNTLITSVYDSVCRRVKVGDDCLNAWTKWIDQRIKL